MYRPMNIWVEFSGEMCLGDSMNMAIEANKINTEAITAVEALKKKFPELYDPTQLFVVAW